MATDAAITAGLAAAVTLNVQASAMVALLKRAIAAPIIDTTTGRYTVSLGSDGGSVNYGSISDMISALRYFQELMTIEAGCITSQQVEMQP